MLAAILLRARGSNQKSFHPNFVRLLLTKSIVERFHTNDFITTVQMRTGQSVDNIAR